MSKQQRNFLIYTNPIYWLQIIFVKIPKRIYFWCVDSPKDIIKLHYKRTWTYSDADKILGKYEKKFINGKEDKCDPISRYYWDRVFIRALRIQKLKKK